MARKQSIQNYLKKTEQAEPIGTLPLNQETVKWKNQPHEMTQHFVSQVRKFPDFLTISKRTVAAVPGKRTKE